MCAVYVLVYAHDFGFMRIYVQILVHARMFRGRSRKPVGAAAASAAAARGAPPPEAGAAGGRQHRHTSARHITGE